MDKGDHSQQGEPNGEPTLHDGTPVVNPSDVKPVVMHGEYDDEEEEEICTDGDGNEGEPLLHSGSSLTTNLDSMMHLMKGNIGTGILAMASAINNAGLWTGVVGIFIIAVIAIHCMHLLVNASCRLCQKTGARSLDYGEVAEQSCENSSATFLRGKGRFARFTINLFLCLTQFGFCIVYVLFIAENLKQVIELYTAIRWDTRIYMCFVLLALVPYVFVRKLKTLSAFSTAANLLTAVGLVIILVYCFGNLQPYFYFPAFSSWAKLPLFFGTTIYAFEGIGVVLPIQNKMKTPEDFGGWNGVLNTGMVLVAVLYTAVGFFGYLTFGSSIQGSITLNLPTDHWLYMAVKVVLSVAIFFTYGLQFYVPAGLIIPSIKQFFASRGIDKPQLIDYGVRIFFVLITFLLAAVIPHLDLMISLVGALASSTLAIIFPPVLDTIVFWDEMGKHWRWRLLKNVLLFIIGFIGFVTGTFISIMEIIEAF